MEQEMLRRTDLERAAYAAIADVALPPEVLEARIHEGEDSDGDPVLRVTLIGRAGDLDKQAIRRVVDGIYEVRRHLLAAPLNRFPLVSFEQAA